MIDQGAVENVSNHQRSETVINALITSIEEIGYAKRSGASYTLQVPQGQVRTTLTRKASSIAAVSYDYADTAYYCLMNINNR